MFRPIRRSFVYLSAAAIFVLVLLLANGLGWGPSTGIRGHRSSSWCPIIPPRKPYRPAKVPGFNWKSVTLKHPISSFIQLSRSRPANLRSIQHSFSEPSFQAEVIRTERRDMVKRVFKRCWNSYKEKAWLADELSPISGEPKNPFGGFAATLIDNLDTLWIMDMKEEFETAVAAAMNISFEPDTSTEEKINIFETTIRHLGGLLAAYDLTGCKDKRLLDKAIQLGDMIYLTFDTEHHMPVTRWNPRSAANGEEQGAADHAIIAELASSSLEMTRLSQLTGDMRYFDIIQRITDLMDSQQNQTKLPGMWGIGINLETLDLTYDDVFGLGAMSDSAYEYLPKMYALLGGIGQAPQYERIYKYAADTIIRHILFRPMVPDEADILFAGIGHADDPSNPYIEPQCQHLTCFVGGMLSLGGRLVKNETHIAFGRKVAEGCVWAYRKSPLGIMPEFFHMVKCPSRSNCTWDEALWFSERNSDNAPPGFASIDDSRYILRPEALESVFYLYRITGDPQWQEYAWEMFSAVERYTRTELANAAIEDVIQDPPVQMDSMESFWMAETLKYLYLVFSEPDFVSLDEYVFNTEAHPFRRP